MSTPLPSEGNELLPPESPPPESSPPESSPSIPSILGIKILTTMSIKNTIPTIFPQSFKFFEEIFFKNFIILIINIKKKNKII